MANSKTEDFLTTTKKNLNEGGKKQLMEAGIAIASDQRSWLIVTL
jgi:hypothetical protein